MSVFTIAVEVWVAIAGAALLVPLMAVVAHETTKAIECLRRDGSEIESVPSRPQPSTPSHHGF
jgi:hypothetical protein